MPAITLDQLDALNRLAQQLTVLDLAVCGLGNAEKYGAISLALCDIRRGLRAVVADAEARS
jgi:hypothetical protein